jgi:hypothetical protein
MMCVGLLLPMKEVKSGFLMLLVCVALYIQFDPRVWNGLCHLLLDAWSDGTSGRNRLAYG